MSALEEATSALSIDDRADSYEVEPGVSVKLEARGAGGSAEEGDAVQCNYKGRVKGKKNDFDQNDGGYPFEFTLGEGKVV
mmetsp:Transcript_29956/g.90067  ORF Transcript_29956/g.90067 Transcript_29956/m.90067 type:complete len:80 (+) Transcript_29956:65-304(+)